MLHLVFQSPIEVATLERIGNGDAVLFVENAVLCLLKNGRYNSQLTELLGSNNLFVLISDIETRGIVITELIEKINVIDYPQWVALTAEHRQVHSWF